MRTPEFVDLAAFIHDWAQLSVEESVHPESKFERDLGITGDDGERLLLAVQKHFGIQLWTERERYREAFHLEDKEYLFNSEAYPIWELLPFVKKSRVRQFTVGDLHTAIVEAAQNPSIDGLA